MKGDVFDNFSWHSAIGIDESLHDSKRFVTRIPNTARARAAFCRVASGNNLLVHRTTKAIWRVSDDNASIEPVYPTDILTEDDVAELMEDAE